MIKYFYILACILSLIAVFTGIHNIAATATLINALLGLYINLKGK